MTRRNFAVSPHDDGWLIRAGGQMLRLSQPECDELVSAIAGDVIAREIAHHLGLER